MASRAFERMHSTQHDYFIFFMHALASVQVVLQAGDVLYVPSFWFHYTVSLTTNIQVRAITHCRVGVVDVPPTQYVFSI